MLSHRSLKSGLTETYAVRDRLAIPAVSFVRGTSSDVDSQIEPKEASPYLKFPNQLEYAILSPQLQIRYYYRITQQASIDSPSSTGHFVDET